MTAAAVAAAAAALAARSSVPDEAGDAGEVELVPEAVPMHVAGAEQFAEIFKKFSEAGRAEPAAQPATAEASAPGEGDHGQGPSDAPGAESDSDDSLEAKRKKKMPRMSVAELKQLTSRPDLVEAEDVSAREPITLLTLKAVRSSVPVPPNWKQKRKYLQNKRGNDKIPYQLPDYIEATGISLVRQSVLEADDAKSLKQKTKERMAPKMGKMDIDYGILHDAFFCHQVKPPLTRIGDVYYEGKEFAVDLRDRRPGVLSAELVACLGIPPGAPPPWLLAMQRYGPPPSYPTLKIPGLNAPIPPGAAYGFHPGGWGMAPVSELGVPLYGDPFGVHVAETGRPAGATGHWGDILELEAGDVSSSSACASDDDGDSSDDGGEAANAQTGADGAESGAGLEARAGDDGLTTPLASVRDTGVQLRKSRAGPDSEAPQALYTVLEQAAGTAGVASLLGTGHTYVLPARGDAPAAGAARPNAASAVTHFSRRTDSGAAVEVSIDADELAKLDDTKLRAMYAKSTQGGASAGEDVSDLLAEGRRAQEQRRKRDAERKDAKRGEFKF